MQRLWASGRIQLALHFSEIQRHHLTICLLLRYEGNDFPFPMDFFVVFSSWVVDFLLSYWVSGNGYFAFVSFKGHEGSSLLLCCWVSIDVLVCMFNILDTGFCYLAGLLGMLVGFFFWNSNPLFVWTKIINPVERKDVACFCCFRLIPIARIERVSLFFVVAIEIEIQGLIIWLVGVFLLCIIDISFVERVFKLRMLPGNSVGKC